MPHVGTTYFVHRSWEGVSHSLFTLLLLQQYDKFIFAYVYEILIMSQASSRGIEHHRLLMKDLRFAMSMIWHTHITFFLETSTNDAENFFLIAQLHRNNHWETHDVRTCLNFFSSTWRAFEIAVTNYGRTPRFFSRAASGITNRTSKYKEEAADYRGIQNYV